MLCGECGQREATIHEVIIRNNQRVERHLCEKCAREQGIDPTPGAGPMAGMVAGYVLGKKQAGQKGSPGAACGECGLTYAQFKESELLGCPACYKAFERQLSPLLERTHEGGTHHVGKIPRRALALSRQGGGERALEEILGDAETRAARVVMLRKKLDEALKSERYERAAQIRDEISKLSHGGVAPSAGGPSEGPGDEGAGDG